VAKHGDDGARIIRYGPYPELTWTALIVGYILGVLITISMGYACLILGFSHEGSELAAILGFGILRGILGRNSIIENNISQTVASSVNGASAGVMFSVPALFILGHTDFNPYLLTFACIAGGILGIAFIIPLRKQMIDFERLTYPGGVAVATVLKSPGAGIKKARLLIIGVILSASLYFAQKIPEEWGLSDALWTWASYDLDGLMDYLRPQFGIMSKPIAMLRFVRHENLYLGTALGLPEYLNGVWFLSLLTVGIAFMVFLKIELDNRFLYLILIGIIPIGVDGVAQQFGLWESNNLIRVVTGSLIGFICGIAIAVIIDELRQIIKKKHLITNKDFNNNSE